jgi:Transcriptional antiterminator
MEQFDARILELIRVLSKKKMFVSAEQLATELNISSKTVYRTIRTYISEINNSQKHGFEIIVKQGRGYLINIYDEESYQVFKTLFFERKPKNSSISEKMERENQIIKYLIFNEQKYNSIQNIADKLFVSESTIFGDLHNVKHKLRKFGITLTHKPAKGIKVLGNEMSFRLCLSKCFIYTQHALVDELQYEKQDMDKIKDIVFQTLNEANIRFSDFSRDHILLHILISMFRMKKDCFITFEKSEIEQIVQTDEYQIAKQIVRRLRNEFIIVDIEEETTYIAIQLLGKKSSNEKNERYPLAKNIEQVLRDIFEEIYSELKIDLREENEVFQYLAMHFEPMLIRLKYGIKANNPLVDEIKNQHLTSFEMGLIAKRIIFDYFHCHIDDDEVSYFAMYFALALDKLNYVQKTKKVLVVCGLGICSSRILVYKLRQQYGKHIEYIETCQFYELKNIILKKFDCIISTVNQPIATNLPVIYIDDFLNGLNNSKLEMLLISNNIKKVEIKKALNQKLFFQCETMRSIEEAIAYLVKGISKVHAVPAKFAEYILEREALSSTAFGNFCAIPHPIKMCTDDTIFSVLVLNKAMLWGNKKVKYIFLLSPSKQSPQDLRYFNEFLVKFISDAKYISTFGRNPTFQAFEELIMDIV